MRKVLLLLLLLVVFMVGCEVKEPPYGEVIEITPSSAHGEYWLVQKKDTDEFVPIESHVGDRVIIKLQHQSGKSTVEEKIYVSPDFARDIQVGDYIKGINTEN